MTEMEKARTQYRNNMPFWCEKHQQMHNPRSAVYQSCAKRLGLADPASSGSGKIDQATLKQIVIASRDSNGDMRWDVAWKQLDDDFKARLLKFDAKGESTSITSNFNDLPSTVKTRIAKRGDAWIRVELWQMKGTMNMAKEIKFLVFIDEQDVKTSAKHLKDKIAGVFFDWVYQEPFKVKDKPALVLVSKSDLDARGVQSIKKSISLEIFKKFPGVVMDEVNRRMGELLIEPKAAEKRIDVFDDKKLHPVVFNAAKKSCRSSPNVTRVIFPGGGKIAKVTRFSGGYNVTLNTRDFGMTTITFTKYNGNYFATFNKRVLPGKASIQIRGRTLADAMRGFLKENNIKGDMKVL